jgi:5'-nucleotidase / UDP-sugar diphosphatase
MPLNRMLLASAALGLSAGPASAGTTLHVLHFNDFHSRIEAINAYDSTCPAEEEAEGECFGGVARLATAIREAREAIEAEGGHVLVLSAGDVFQGSLFFTTYQGEAEAEFMNRIGLDAMVYGNHEFDLGPDPLAAFIEAADFPVISGNTDVSADNRLASLAQGPLVFEFDGVPVAVVGAVTPDTAEIANPGPTVSFEDPVPYLTETVAALEEDGISYIVALTHLGMADDRRIAEEVPGLDAVVGGHDHALFANDVDGAAQPYPWMVAGADGGEVPVVQAGAYSRYLGHLVLTFDDAGEVTAAEGEPVLLDASVEPDPEILGRIEELRAPIEEAMGEVVGSVAAPLDGSRESCRARECAMGNLVADAMLDRVADQGVDIAIQNGGGLRASIDAGEVTMGEVVSVLPFQNTLATFDLSGAGVVAALENGVSQVEEGAGRFPQVAGLRYTWDPAQPPGSRIAEVLVRDGGDWAPIDPEASYGVVSNNFMRGGGDGYTVFLEEAENPYDYGPNLEMVLAEYLGARPDYAPFTEDRITRAE